MPAYGGLSYGMASLPERAKCNWRGCSQNRGRPPAESAQHETSSLALSPRTVIDHGGAASGYMRAVAHIPPLVKSSTIEPSLYAINLNGCSSLHVGSSNVIRLPRARVSPLVSRVSTLMRWLAGSIEHSSFRFCLTTPTTFLWGRSDHEPERPTSSAIR